MFLLNLYIGTKVVPGSQSQANFVLRCNNSQDISTNTLLTQAYSHTQYHVGLECSDKVCVTFQAENIKPSTTVRLILKLYNRRIGMCGHSYPNQNTAHNSVNKLIFLKTELHVLMLPIHLNLFQK